MVGRRRQLFRTLLLGLFVLGLGLAVEHRAVAHFSPHTLQLRNRSEWFVGPLEITWLRREQFKMLPSVRYLMDKGYWTAVADNSVWIEMYYRRQGVGVTGHGRALLWNLLRLRWERWSKENPTIALEFWPEVLELLRSGRHHQAELLLQVGEYQLTVDQYREIVSGGVLTDADVVALEGCPRWEDVWGPN